MRSKPKAAMYPWKAQFLEKFPWLQYDSVAKIASCSQSNCNKYHFNIFIRANLRHWTKSFETRLFKQHQDSDTHQRTSRNKKLDRSQKKLDMSPAINGMEDTAIWIRIQTIFWLAKEDIAITNSVLC